MADETCGAFNSTPDFDQTMLHRFIVGADASPRPMTSAEVAKLADPFAKRLLSKGKFPQGAEDLIEKLKAAVPAKDPLQDGRSFVLGEGSQIAPSAKSAGVERNLRFVVTLGRGPDGPDVFISIFNPTHPGGVEVMAWDAEEGGFNYYRSARTSARWMFGGNSRHALRDSSRGKGVFESHRSGALLMKELKTPWVHWDSPAANIFETALESDERQEHRFFKEKDPNGALAFETDAARPAISRWARARFERIRKGAGEVTRPRQIMEQILDTPTVNLHSTHIESDALSPSSVLDLPTGFFLDHEALCDTLGLEPPPQFNLSGKIYAKALGRFDVRLDDGQGFSQKGDTHFCFVVPERAFEDLVVLREAIEIGLLSRRLAAALLMVDPWNPVFSDRRRSLLQHAPATATVKNRRSRFSREMSGAILAAAEVGPPGTPEAEFAKRWQAGASFKGPFSKLLNAYYKGIESQLKKQSGFDAYFKLAEERRHIFKETMPIAEFALLLPETNVEPSGLRMRKDGTVGT